MRAPAKAAFHLFERKHNTSFSTMKTNIQGFVIIILLIDDDDTIILEN